MLTSLFKKYQITISLLQKPWKQQENEEMFWITKQSENIVTSLQLASNGYVVGILGNKKETESRTQKTPYLYHYPWSLR